MTRAIACQSRTIRLPVHLSERLASIRKVSLYQSLIAITINDRAGLFKGLLD